MKMTQGNTCRSESTPILPRKIQNRESARRVRLREKDGATCLQSRFIEMQENNQRLQIENTALRSENIMLRNQVEFMEKLLLQRTNLPSGSVDEEHKLSRVEARGTVSKNIGVIALVCMVLVATYLPEQSSGSSQDGTIQQRMLSEISTGFNLFNSKNLASLFLSLFRVAAFMTILGYISYTGILAYKKASKRSEEDILQGLISKKNS
jgi:hypothetical protein